MKSFRKSSFTRWSLVSLALAVILGLTLACAKKEPADIKIGAILPLTGDGATLGQDCKNGIDLAMAQVNKPSKTRIKVLYEDSQGKPDQAVSAYNKLVGSNIKVIIGDLFSAPTLAIAPLADRDKVFVFSPGASNPKLSGASKYVFRNYPSDNFEGKLIAKYAKEHSLNRVAVLFPTNDYGVGLKDVFQEYFQNLGGSIALLESYDDNVTDFRSPLLKVKAARDKIDALYLPGYYGTIGRIAVQAKELGLNVQMLSNVGVEDPKLLEIASNAVEGLIYTAPAVDLSSPDSTIQNFVRSYKATFSKDPGFPAAHGYDTAKILLSLIKERGIDPDLIREGLLADQFIGVTGKMTYTQKGDVIKPFVLKTVVERQFRIVAYIAL